MQVSQISTSTASVSTIISFLWTLSDEKDKKNYCKKFNKKFQAAHSPAWWSYSIDETAMKEIREAKKK